MHNLRVMLRADNLTTLPGKLLALSRLPGWLALSGGLSLALWYFAFSRRYSLVEYGRWPLQSIATISNMAFDSALLYVFCFVALFGVYWFGARQVSRLRGSPTPHLVWLGGFAIVFNVALLPMYPVDAADIYDYIIRGRMSAVYGLNPLHDTPERVRSDPFYNFAAWREVTSAYGPAWEMIAALTSRLAGNDRIANVVAYKLVAVLGYLATMLLIGLTLRRIAPERVLLGVYLFAWNPLVVYMAGGTGHNDLVMTALVIGSLYFLVRRWYVASTLAALVGALIKFIPLMLIPVIALVALRELPARLRIRYLITSAALGALLLVIFFGPFWTGWETLSLERRTRMFTGSMATLVRQSLIPVLDHKPSDTYNSETPITNGVVNTVALAAFGLFYLFQLARLWRQREPLDPSTPIYVVTAIIVFYLLVSSVWFQSWYAIWAVALVALLGDSLLRRLVLLFSYLVTWQPFLYNYVTLRPGGWMPLPWRDLIPIGTFMGGAWAYVGWSWLSARFQKRESVLSNNPEGVTSGTT